MLKVYIEKYTGLLKMIKIGKRIISKYSKPLIVAEIGINHFGSLKVAKKIVDEAKKIM